MKKIIVLCAMLLCLLGLATCATAGQAFMLDEIDVAALFPDGWTVVTRGNVGDHTHYFDADSAEAALLAMQAEDLYAVAYAPSGDLSIRVTAHQRDADVRQYFDIERYTPAMRKALAEGYLDRAAWALTGYRYTEADWTNKADQGRILNLTYNVRSGEDVTARGQQAFTVRNGWAFTLDIQAQGRRLETAETRLFAQFVTDTIFPESLDMPLLPAGLTLTSAVPEETYKAEVSLRGETTKGATVGVWLLPEEGDPIHMGSDKANSGGEFRIDILLPGQGEWRLYLKAELDGYASSEAARWITYNPRQIPVTFTSYPTGNVYDSQIIISGTTLSGVTIQCMEGDTNKKTKTGSGGAFSFTLDRTLVGERTVILSFSKGDFDNRRYEITFNRQWEREAYATYLDGVVQSLSYANLSERADKYIGRLVKYTGTVLHVSSGEGITYVQLGLKQDKSGRWTEQIVAEAENLEMILYEGDTATLYIEVTGDSYSFPDMTEDGIETLVELPSVKLLSYTKKAS